MKTTTYVVIILFIIISISIVSLLTKNEVESISIESQDNKIITNSISEITSHNNSSLKGPQTASGKLLSRIFGDPIPNAKIQVIKSKSLESNTEVYSSNNSGEFTISYENSETVKIFIQAEGFSDKIIQISLFLSKESPIFLESEIIHIRGKIIPFVPGNDIDIIVKPSENTLTRIKKGIDNSSIFKEKKGSLELLASFTKPKKPVVDEFGEFEFDISIVGNYEISGTSNFGEIISRKTLLDKRNNSTTIEQRITQGGIKGKAKTSFDHAYDNGIVVVCSGKTYIPHMEKPLLSEFIPLSGQVLRFRRPRMIPTVSVFQRERSSFIS